ncbi:MAG: ATP-binding protein [Thiotrichales bacterium]
MYHRLFNPPANKSFFLFGPRGTGKTTWLKTYFADAIYLDFLRPELFQRLLGSENRLEEYIPADYAGWVILDEIQKIPNLLDEVHRLIEERKNLRFVLTGSSARKLHHSNVNLLAGRALQYHFFPLTVAEVGNDFNLLNALKYGMLPSIFTEDNPKHYLQAYIQTYLEQEVQQEGLTRNIGAFSRFLEIASFSQGESLNITDVAREAHINRKVAENYFSILEDLLIAFRLPVFTKRAKRKMTQHRKFYFFDTGIYYHLRPKGVLDSPEELEGVCLESLVLQEIRALNAYHDWGYTLSFWRTATGIEVDIVCYGDNGFYAIEIKRNRNVSSKHLSGLKNFREDYPQATPYFVYGGQDVLAIDGIRVIPVVTFLRDMAQYLAPIPQVKE